jgi:hypothetical protein
MDARAKHEHDERVNESATPKPDSRGTRPAMTDLESFAQPGAPESIYPPNGQSGTQI